MTTINCIIFDDVPSEASAIEFALTENWKAIQETHRHVPDLECTCLNDTKIVLDRLKSPNHGIQLFLCDILVPNRLKTQEMLGLQLIKQAKTRPAIPVVIAISKGPDPKHASDFYGKITSAGANKYFEKTDFLNRGGAALTEFIVDSLATLGLLHYRGTLNREAGQELNPVLEAAFEKISPTNLSAISNYFCFNSTTEAVYISALKPGLSGADILVARYVSEIEDLSRKGVLLKISRDPGRLNDEYDMYRREIIGSQLFSSSLIVDFLPQKQPFLVNGWTALGSRFEHRATTMLNWLSQSERTEVSVKAILDELFAEDGLSATCKATQQVMDGEAITKFNAAFITPYRKVRILDAVQDLEPLVARYSDITNLNLLKQLLSKGELGELSRDKIENKTVTSIQHGDLHSSNVLVATIGSKHRPKIIDYANIARLPWCADIVRFFVDILVSGVDKGPESHEWGNLKRWTSLSKFLAFEEAPVDALAVFQDQATYACAIRWVNANLFSATGVVDTPQRRAEYQFALGLEFMRASYRKDELTAPKRAFGLVAAEAAFVQAEKSFFASVRKP